MIVAWPDPRSVNDYMRSCKHVGVFIITIWKSVVRTRIKYNFTIRALWNDEWQSWNHLGEFSSNVCTNVVRHRLVQHWLLTAVKVVGFNPPNLHVFFSGTLGSSHEGVYFSVRRPNNSGYKCVFNVLVRHWAAVGGVSHPRWAPGLPQPC